LLPLDAVRCAVARAPRNPSSSASDASSRIMPSVCCNALSLNRSMRARFIPSTCFALSFVSVRTSNVTRNPSCRFPTRPTRATEMRKTSSAFALSNRSRISHSSLSSLSPDLSACTNRAAVLSLVRSSVYRRPPSSPLRHPFMARTCCTTSAVCNASSSSTRPSDRSSVASCWDMSSSVFVSLRILSRAV